MPAFEWFIAWRYLFSRERRVLASVNALISVAGVAVGVAVLVVVTAIMDGGIHYLTERITDLTPHVTITNIGGGPTVSVDPSIAERLRADPRVVFAEPVTSRPTLIQRTTGVETEKDMIQIMALPHLGGGTLFEFGGALTSGEITLADDEILLGRSVAERLAITHDSEILLLPIAPGASPRSPRIRPYRLRLRDLFETGYYEFDANVAFVSPARIADMFHTDGAPDYIHVKLDDPMLAEAFVRDLSLPVSYQAIPWTEKEAEYFAALKFQKILLFIVLLLIIVVAAFNVIGTLVLMVFEKTREIGILKAIGTRPASVARIFLIDGLLIGLSGTVAGVAIGLAVSLGLKFYRFELPASVYDFDTLPVRHDPLTIALIGLCALGICTLASLLPALQASRLDPVEALRYE